VPSLNAQEVETDTLSVPSTDMVSGFQDNLDSLLNLWYVQQALQTVQAESILPMDEDTLVPDFPDSVYIARLASLPFVMDLSYNRIVKNFIDLYTHKRIERVGVMLTLSEYYFPMFEEIFDAYGIPHELKYLAVIESALNPRAVSRAGATGMWQFMHYTGKQYNLTINSLVDERRDPYKATIAAARFLKDLYAIYKDWNLAIAAYNCGPGNVNKAIRRSGGKRNYWDIYYHLPRETRGYVPAFIAASYVMNFYAEHNISPTPVDFNLNSDTLHIREKLHLGQVAGVLNLSINQLRDYNPQYKYDVIPGDGRDYILRIPQTHSMRFIELQDSIFAWRDSIFFNDKNFIISPTASNYSTPVLPSDKYTRLSYTVKSGDNLGFISTWYNVRLSDIRYWNNIRSDVIRAGQKLVIYVPNASATRYKGVDGMSFAEKQALAGVTVKTPAQPSASVNSHLPGEYTLYTVRNGDSLWDIARKFPGVSDSDIARMNNLGTGNNIKPGQVLKVPKL
jgi:membrane-bound lytic murein transglycosylase D